MKKFYRTSEFVGGVVISLLSLRWIKAHPDDVVILLSVVADAYALSRALAKLHAAKTNTGTSELGFHVVAQLGAAILAWFSPVGLWCLAVNYACYALSRGLVKKVYRDPKATIWAI